MTPDRVVVTVVGLALLVLVQLWFFGPRRRG
jgi:hypothetical protein